MREYPALDHLFVAGEGKATPEEYVGRAGHVAPEVVKDLATWVYEVVIGSARR